jgi:hypothetical protein
MSTTRPPAFDDRFATPVEASRRGAHRARPSALTTVLPVAAGLAVVSLVGFGAWALTGQDSNSGTVAAASTASPARNTAAAVVPSPSLRQQSPTSAAPSTPPSSSPASPATTSAGAAGRTLPVVVLSSVTTQGLAKRQAQTLEHAGWTVSRTGNATLRNLSTTRVYYATSTDKPAAQLLLSDLGYGVLMRSATIAANGLTIVLGTDANA